MAVPLYSGLPASKMKKMLEKVLTSSLIPAMTGSESFHWWTCFSKAALGTDDLPGVELGFAAEELILAVFCSKEPEGIL